MTNAIAQTKAAQGSDHVRDALGKVLEMVETGRVPEAMARHLLTPTGTDRPADRWSLGNRLILAIEGSEDARGFHQWRAVGRFVQKGAKAVWILAPMTRKVAETDPATGEEQERVVVVGFKAVPVFRFEDTDGEALEHADYAPVEAPPFMEACEAFGIRVEYGPTTRGEYGYHRTLPTGGEMIHLSSHDPDTLWHELGHAAHARVLAETGGRLVGGQQPDQEVVAELVAATIGTMLGQEAGMTGWQIRYMAGYAGSREALVRSMLRLMDTAEQCVKRIMAAAEAAQAARTAEIAAA